MNVRQIALTTPFSVEQQAIDRQMKLAQLLQQDALEPVQSLSPTAPISWTQGIAKMLKAYNARKEMEGLDKRSADLQNAQREDTINTMGDYTRLLQGAQAKPTDNFVMQIPEGSDAPEQAMASAVAPDRQAALARLLQSQNPMLQQVGLSGMLAEQKPEEFNTTPYYDKPGNAFVISKAGNVKYLPGIQARDKFEATEGIAFNPYAPNQQMPINSFGKPQMVNGEAVQFDARNKAHQVATRPPQTNVNVNTDKGILSGVGDAVGKAIETDLNAARGAVKTISTAQSIMRNIDSGDIISGPFADKRIDTARLAQIVGVGGKDNEQKLIRTNEVIRGLSQLVVANRQQLQSQGQITDFETKLLEKAESGNLSMTPAEIRRLAELAETSARFHIDRNANNARNLQSDPRAASAIPYMQIDQPPEYKKPEKRRTLKDFFDQYGLE